MDNKKTILIIGIDPLIGTHPQIETLHPLEIVCKKGEKMLFLGSRIPEYQNIIYYIYTGCPEKSTPLFLGHPVVRTGMKNGKPGPGRVQEFIRGQD